MRSEKFSFHKERVSHYIRCPLPGNCLPGTGNNYIPGMYVEILVWLLSTFYNRVTVENTLGGFSSLSVIVGVPQWQRALENHNNNRDGVLGMYVWHVQVPNAPRSVHLALRREVELSKCPGMLGSVE